jgi:hypothetical protein
MINKELEDIAEALDNSDKKHQLLATTIPPPNDG